MKWSNSKCCCLETSFVYSRILMIMMNFHSEVIATKIYIAKEMVFLALNKALNKYKVNYLRDKLIEKIEI